MYTTHFTAIQCKQSGFRQRHSTETALIEIIDESLFKDSVSGMILIDYCKAFDMADHSIAKASSIWARQQILSMVLIICRR